MSADQPAPAGDDELREAVSLLTDIPEETPAVLVEEAAATVLVELERLRAEQHEMTCPACQATIRSRLADTAARAEVERLRRALAGHLFDGESLSTREALRSELVEQGLKDSAELERLHTWAGLMSLLDEHYPADVMTGESGDPGPRIVALVRELDRLRAILGKDA